MSYKTWAAKQSGNPKLLLIAIVGFAFSAYGFHKYAYAPWARRRRLSRAEEYANFIFLKENEKK